jgi:hypothetical protein
MPPEAFVPMYSSDERTSTSFILPRPATTFAVVTRGD